MPAPRTDPARLVRDALDKNLLPQEEVRWSGAVTQFKAPPAVMFLLGWGLLLPIFGSVVALALTKLWYVGLTPDRVLLGHVKRPFQPDPDGVFTVPLGDVTVGRKHHGELLIATSQKGLPTRFRLTRGTDLAMLEALLTQGVSPAAPLVPAMPPVPQG